MKQVPVGERFQWAQQLLPTLKSIEKQFENDGVVFYSVIAAHADIKNRNNRIYTSNELKHSAASLSERPLNINHNPKKTLPFPENQVIAARYEDDEVECIIQVADPAINEQIKSGEISKVSIEGLYLDESKNTGDTEFPTSLHFKALALLTSNDEPGDPMAEILKDHLNLKGMFLPGEIKEKISLVMEFQFSKFETSGEANVCPICLDLDGKTWASDEVPASATPPIHPNCNCSLQDYSADNKSALTKKLRSLKRKDDYTLNTIQETPWTGSFINNLPDSSFAFVEPGGKKDEEGKTVPRSLRHFPYKDADGAIDKPHLRNALARLSQSAISPQGKSAARKELVAAAAKAGIQTSMDEALPKFQSAWEDYRIAEESRIAVLEGMGLAQPEKSGDDDSLQDFDGKETSPKMVNPDEQTKKHAKIERDIPSTGQEAPAVKSLQPVGGSAPEMDPKMISANPQSTVMPKMDHPLEQNPLAVTNDKIVVTPEVAPNLETALKNATPNTTVTTIPHVNEKVRKPIIFTVSK